MDNKVNQQDRTPRDDRTERPTPEQGASGTGNSWFTNEADEPPSSEQPGQREPEQREPRQQQPQQQQGTAAPHPAAAHSTATHSAAARAAAPRSTEQDAEQRYADALAALNRMMSTFDFKELSWVTEVLRATAGALPEQDPSRPGVLNNLGSAAQLAHLASGDLAHLEDAVTYYRSAAEAASSDDPDVVLYLSNLALALTDCAGRKGSAEQAVEAVDVARLGVERTGTAGAGGTDSDSADLPRHRDTALIRLGNALKLHARLAADNDSDDESIEVFQAALRESSGQDGAQRPEGPDLMISLGSALLRRHERTTDPNDLDEGIKYLRTGVGMLPDGQHRRWMLLRFAEALRLRYRQRGDLTDLQSAINELFGVLDDLESGNPVLGKLIWNLTSATVEHLDSSGESGNLYRALKTISPVMRNLATDDPNRAVALASYGALARRHYMHAGNTAALDTAVAAGEAALDAETTAPKRCAVLNSLASTLITRFERAGQQSDLDRAHAAASEALQDSEQRTAPQYTAYAQLGVVSTHQHRLNSRNDELETAIEMFDRALIAMPDSAPERVTVATHLGRALQTLHRRTGRRKLYRWARRTLTEAATLPTGPADQRLKAANLCGRLAAQAHRWSEALESFTLAVELLPLVTQGKRAVATPTVQRRWAHVTADAAACAIEVGKPERAVELLEHGRAALLSELMPAGSELGQLNLTHPDLATDAVRLRRLLDRHPEEPILGGVDVIDDVRRRRWLADTWDELLDEIRNESGGDRMRPWSFDTLATAADEGAVVLINLSEFRSDAVIVFGGRALVVRLPGVTPELAEEHAASALNAAQQAQRTADTERTLGMTLDWLWQHVTRPVLERMGYTRTPPQGARWPRLWWSTQGAAAFLPLHAATSTGGDSALDRVVSSHTPGLRVLLTTKRRRERTGADTALIAGPSDERTPDQPGRIPARHWSSATAMSERDHTADDVFAAFGHHQLIHVCEPSTQHAAQPAAGLVLDREDRARSLNLLDIGQRDFGDAKFLCLARCRTKDAPSAAALTMAGAFAFIGFAHVISTLWAMHRGPAEDVLAALYAELARDGEFRAEFSAGVLHATTRRLRRRYPEAPTLWAGYTHVGV
ncbi:CHAT domain-containing protein [Actinopolyspora lacussalsi subsp. righensis]|uniref:CHAT domain-containing protein n=1 Tax=Actinopolyspora righensis TaxID=995060 RepID=A0A1I6Z8N5_9ACTN|nr:CHAT domain-containing protein [Actinopolyspora righensis]SFT59059.1 CHAT domain-containing protein [Actinopolyspora righensis]